MSNNVQNPNDEVEIEAGSEVCTLCLKCVQTCSCVYKPGLESESMRGGAGRDMKPKIHTECEECARIHTMCTECVQTCLKNVQCVQAESSQPGASRDECQAVPEARKLCKSKFHITNIEGGGFL